MRIVGKAKTYILTVCVKLTASLTFSFNRRLDEAGVVRNTVEPVALTRLVQEPW